MNWSKTTPFFGSCFRPVSALILGAGILIHSASGFSQSQRSNSPETSTVNMGLEARDGDVNLGSLETRIQVPDTAIEMNFSDVENFVTEMNPNVSAAKLDPLTMTQRKNKKLNKLRVIAWTEFSDGPEGGKVNLYYKVPRQGNKPDRVVTIPLQMTPEQELKLLRPSQLAKDMVSDYNRVASQKIKSGVGTVKDILSPYRMSPIRLSWETTVFYAGLGALVKLNMLDPEFNNLNPVAWSQHHEHSLSIVGVTGIWVFMGSSGVAGKLLQRTFLGKYSFLQAGAGLGLGGFMQSIWSEFWMDPNLRICAAGIQRQMHGKRVDPKEFQTTEKACDDAFDHWVVHKQLIKLAPQLISMVTGGILQQYITSKLFGWTLRAEDRLKDIQLAGRALVVISCLINPARLGFQGSERVASTFSLALKGENRFTIWLSEKMGLVFSGGHGVLNILSFGAVDQLLTPRFVRFVKGNFKSMDLETSAMQIADELRRPLYSDKGTTDWNKLSSLIAKFSQQLSDWRGINLEKVYEHYSYWMIKLNNLIGWYKATEIIYSHLIREVRNSKNMALLPEQQKFDWVSSFLEVQQGFKTTSREIEAQNQFDQTDFAEQNQMTVMMAMGNALLKIMYKPSDLVSWTDNFKVVPAEEKRKLVQLLDYLNPKDLVLRLKLKRAIAKGAKVEIPVFDAELVFAEKESFAKAAEFVKSEYDLIASRASRSDGNPDAQMYRWTISQAYRLLGMPRILRTVPGEALLRTLPHSMMAQGMLKDLEIPASEYEQIGRYTKDPVEYLVQKMLCGPVKSNMSHILKDEDNWPSIFSAPRLIHESVDTSQFCNPKRDHLYKSPESYAKTFLEPFFATPVDFAMGGKTYRLPAPNSGPLEVVKNYIRSEFLGDIGPMQERAKALLAKTKNRVRINQLWSEILKGRKEVLEQVMLIQKLDDQISNEVESAEKSKSPINLKRIAQIGIQKNSEQQKLDKMIATKEAIVEKYNTEILAYGEELKKVDPEPLKGFNDWWEKYVDPEIKPTFEHYALMYNSVIKELLTAMRDTGFEGHNVGDTASNGIIVSMRQQLRFYSLILGDIVKKHFQEVPDLIKPGMVNSPGYSVKESDPLIQEYRVQQKRVDFWTLGTGNAAPPFFKLMSSHQVLDIGAIGDVLEKRKTSVEVKNFEFQENLLRQFDQLMALFDRFEDQQIESSGKRVTVFVSRTNNEEFTKTVENITKYIENLRVMLGVRGNEDMTRGRKTVEGSIITLTEPEEKVVRLILLEMTRLASELESYGKIANWANWENFKSLIAQSVQTGEFVDSAEQKARETRPAGLRSY